MNKTKMAAGLLGLTGVALGAFGAHALKPTLVAHGMLDVWDRAVIYHLVHAVAVFVIAATLSASRPWLARAAVCWTVGVVLFSGSLYTLALGGSLRWLWPVTPLGGLAFLLGWSFVAIDSLCTGTLEKS